MHDITVLTIIKIHQGWVLIPLSFHHAPSVASDRKVSSVMGRRIKRRDSEMSLVSVSLTPWLALFFFTSLYWSTERAIHWPAQEYFRCLQS